jgi:hypothetical protein
MPVITPPGGVSAFPADSTAGSRGKPDPYPQEGGTDRFPGDSPRPDDEPIGTDVRGGNEKPARITPTSVQGRSIHTGAKAGNSRPNGVGKTGRYGGTGDTNTRGGAPAGSKTRVG